VGPPEWLSSRLRDNVVAVLSDWSLAAPPRVESRDGTDAGPARAREPALEGISPLPSRASVHRNWQGAQRRAVHRSEDGERMKRESGRVGRLEDLARRQGLILTRQTDGSWTLIPLEVSAGWQLLSRDRQRLADGRELAIRMTLDEIEAFLVDAGAATP
jgi:hypothetical protein